MPALRLLRDVEDVRAVVAPAEARIVLEADQHPRLGGARTRQVEDRAERAGNSAGRTSGIASARLLGRRVRLGEGYRRVPELVQFLTHPLRQGTPQTLRSRCGAACSSRRRSRDAAVGFVGRALPRHRSASRRASTSRSTASSRLRRWLRSSCATARSDRPGAGDDAPFLGVRQRSARPRRRIRPRRGSPSAARAARRPAGTREAQLDLVERGE